MHFGIINLFCPICGKPIRYDHSRCGEFLFSPQFGTVCSAECHEAGQLKWTRMVLGKDDPENDLKGESRDEQRIDAK